MKIGLVVEGGGMKCAYSAGILDKFLDDHIQFDYCIGVVCGCSKHAVLSCRTTWKKSPFLYGTFK